MTQKTALGHLVSIQSGHSPSTFELSDNGQFPYVKVEDMNNCQKYQCKSREYTNDPSRIVPKGAVIFPKRGAAIMNNKVRIAGTELCMDTNMMAIIPNGKVAGEFLYYAVLKEQLFQIADTSTIPQINNKHINPHKIPLPPLPEQEAIAEVLECWDKAIRNLESKIVKKRLIKKGLMQKLLSGQTRLPGFSKPWKTVRLGKICSRVTRKNTVGCSNLLTISGQQGLVNQEEYFKKRIAAHDVSGYFLLKKGEFAYNKSYCNGYPFGAIKRLDRYDNGVVSTLYICFKISSDDIDFDFLEFYFDNGIFNRELYKIAAEGARNHGLLNVPPSDFFRGKITIPEKKEQQAIAEVLAAADGEIEALERKLALWKDQKKFLLNNLVAGTIRLPEFKN